MDDYIEELLLQQEAENAALLAKLDWLEDDAEEM